MKMSRARVIDGWPPVEIAVRDRVRLKGCQARAGACRAVGREVPRNSQGGRVGHVLNAPLVREEVRTVGDKRY